MPKPRVSVLSPHRHPRLRYVLKYLSHDLGLDFVPQTSGARPAGAGAATVLEYGSDRFPAADFLAGHAPHPADLNSAARTANGVPIFFDGDLLASIFYALSRYEEYDPNAPRDEHDRFPATASHAHQHGYLEMPVVRHWAAEIARRLGPSVRVKPRPPRLAPTYDIDIAYAYKYRGLRGILSGAKDLLTGHPRRALARFHPGHPDPFDRFSDLAALHKKTGLPATFFWLLADKTDYRNANPHPIPAEQIQLMRSLTEKNFSHGIHPGYGPFRDQEFTTYKQIFGHIPTHSRQHFLLLRLPDTYRELMRRGITHDHTMGYADAPGWRNGTNLPFYWYDLERERQTFLTVHPFLAMDVTLKNYRNLSARSAFGKLRELVARAHPFGGPLPLLFHNSSFAHDYGWADWWTEYKALLLDQIK